MGLKEQIEAWPEAMKAAYIRVAEAESALNELALEQRRVRKRQRDVEDNAAIAPMPELRLGQRIQQYAASMEQQTGYRQRYAEVEERVRFAYDDLGRAKAAADVQLRREAEQAGKKVTEGALKAQVQLHPDVLAAEERLRDAHAQRRALQLERTTYTGQPLTIPATPVTPAYQPSEDTALAKAEAALAKEIDALKRRRVALLRELEVARADVAYLCAVGKSLALLTELAAAELRAR